MKLFLTVVYTITLSSMLLSCKKNGDEASSKHCEEDNTAVTTFTNSGNISLRVQVATSLTDQFAPINPKVNVDLEPGASVSKALEAEKYFIVWSRDCPSNCSTITYYSKTYAACSENNETQGLGE